MSAVADPMTPDDEQRLRELLEMHPALLQPEAIEMRRHLLDAREDVTAVRAQYRDLMTRAKEIERQRDHLHEQRGVARSLQRKAERERDVHAEDAGTARDAVERLREDAAGWRKSYERLSRQVLRRHHAWQSAKRGRRSARLLNAELIRSMDMLRAEVIDERRRRAVYVREIEAERDRLAEQVRVLAEKFKRAGTQARCSVHPEHADPDCETCRDVEIFRAALDGTEVDR